jgi:dihydroxyacid dehydratase/phosphogluconate dehydratase
MKTSTESAASGDRDPRDAASAPKATRRSSNWFAAHDLPAFLQRAALCASGISRASIDNRPLVGICSSWSELVSCNMHFRGLIEAVRRGVLQAGGLPIEFPTITLGENLLKPTAMLLRNLMAMDVEESIRAYPFDAVVLLGGCDKTGPAQLMGAVSADVPAIMMTGGPANPAVFRGRRLGVGTDLWHYVILVAYSRYAARLGSRRARWLVRRRSSGVPVQ